MSDAREVSNETRDEIERQVKEVKDDELVDFIRDTVTRLDMLANRLAVIADNDSGNDTEGRHHV
jgi:nitrogen-specific signal transduction histidine kinase